MGRTVAELDATMSPEEFRDWAAYHDEEPWGAPAEDHRWETVCSILYSANSPSGTKIPTFFDRRPDETLARQNHVTTDVELERLFDVALARQEAKLAKSS